MSVSTVASHPTALGWLARWPSVRTVTRGHVLPRRANRLGVGTSKRISRERVLHKSVIESCGVGYLIALRAAESVQMPAPLKVAAIQRVIGVSALNAWARRSDPRRRGEERAHLEP